MLIEGEASAAGESTAAPRLVFWHLPGTTREEVLAGLARGVAGAGVPVDPDELAARLLERERQKCTAHGAGIAIPHCRLDRLEGVVIAAATTSQPIDFGASDGLPIEVIFLVAGPSRAPALILQALARVSRLLRSSGVTDRLRRAGSAEELSEILKETENQRAAGVV
jgi:PTS system nitrogen regulatory IIA component